MLRTLSGALVMLWGTMASAQVVFAPPEPCYPKDTIDPRVRELIYALHYPRTNIFINATPNGGAYPVVKGPIIIIPSGDYVSPEALGVDPCTGQQNYFRKRDLLPQPVTPVPVPPGEEPATQPQAAPADPNNPAAKGQIIIKPWRGGGGKVANR